MQHGSATFEAYVRNIRRTAECRQSQHQLRHTFDARSLLLVQNPYGIGIEQTSAITPFGRDDRGCEPVGK